MSTDAAILATNLSKVYRVYKQPIDLLKELLSPGRQQRHHLTHALHPLSLSIQPGERVGILGSNGSGKSTLLKIIAGVLTPSTGSVQTRGRISSLLELGIGFNSLLTGAENIRQYAMIQGLSRDEIDAQFAAIVEFSELGDYVQQPVRTYSSGMILRLAFSCAVFTRPDILIIDEALSVGDAYFQNKCLHKIRSMLETGATFLYVSHSPDSVRSLCTRGIVLNNGHLVFDGPADSAAREYEKQIMTRMQSHAIAEPDGSAAETAAIQHTGTLPGTPISRQFESRVASMRTGSRRALITNIMLTDAAGVETTEINFNEPVTLRIYFTVHQPLSAPAAITVGLTDTLGNTLVHFNSLDQGIDISGMAPGSSGAIEFSFRNIFCPGDISVIAGIDHMVRDSIHPAFWQPAERHDAVLGGTRFYVRHSTAPASLFGRISTPATARLLVADSISAKVG